MPFDGSGTYTPAAAPNFPATAGTTIVASYYNAVINDIATAFNNCLTRDGQGKPSAAISWNNQNLTNVGTLSATTATFTNALGRASGGTGVATAPTNGQLLIGNGTGYTLATITGDSNIQVNNGAGTISLAFVGGGGSVTSVNASGGTTGLSFSGGPITASGTLTLDGTLAIAHGGTGAATAGAARLALGVAASGIITGSGLTVSSNRLLGRITAATGAIEEILLGSTLTFTSGALVVQRVPNDVTFDNSGSGAASGTTFNGSAARTISYNSIGAQPVTPRVQSVASSATVTPTATNDIVVVTAQAANLTLAAPTGSPVQGQGLVVRIKDNGTSRTLTLNAIYREIGATVPAATTVNKTLYLGMIYNSTDTKWDIVAVAEEA